MKKLKIKPLLGIILTFLITGIVTSVLVYLYIEQEIQNLNSELTLLKTNTAAETTIEQEDVDANEVGNDEDTDLEEVEEEAENEEEDPYAVIYVPGGLFQGEEERAALREKLVVPYFDYYNDPEHGQQTKIISMSISKDEEDTYYEVSVVRKDTYPSGGYGHNGFLFGSTEEDFGYWIPQCLDVDCEFSENYRILHPEVVEAYEECPNCYLDVDM
jgi:hypothetical protein